MAGSLQNGGDPPKVETYPIDHLQGIQPFLVYANVGQCVCKRLEASGMGLPNDSAEGCLVGAILVEKRLSCRHKLFCVSRAEQSKLNGRGERSSDVDKS